MSPNPHGRNKPLSRDTFREDTIERLGIIDLFPLKTKSRVFYITINPKILGAYNMLPGDLLKVHLIEVRKHRERAEAPPI